MRWAAVALAAVACGPKAPLDVRLDPPPSGQGWQWQAGPFSVAAGTEVQACYFFAVPGDAGADVWVDRVTVAQNAGSHHLNVFRVRTIVGLGGNPGDVVADVAAGGQLVSGSGQCFKSSNWADWPLVVNSQDAATVDWALPDGVGMRFSAGDLLMVQTHFVNATTQKTPGTAKVLANFHLAPAPPASELGTVFATNQNIRVCPGESSVSFEARCLFPQSGVTVVAANGHFHSRGTDFTIAPVDGAGQVGPIFYQSKVWDEPPMARGLDVALPAGGGIDWRCSYSAAPDACGDPADRCCFTFGGHVDSQEHCNAFVYYYPKTVDVNCF